MKEILEDVYGPVHLMIEESEDGRLVARGEFGHCGMPTANGRVYSRQIMEREFGRLGNKMETRAMYGELDHPDDGKTSLKRVSHLIRGLRIESGGKVTGELEVLDHPDVPSGRLLKGLVECGVRLGVSSRGVGSVRKNKNGNFEVQEDFRLLTYDVVADPAWGQATPGYTRESEEVDGPTVSEGYMTLEELEAKHPQLMEAARKKAAEGVVATYEHRLAEKEREMESTVASSMERVYAEALNQGRAEAHQDQPSSAEREVLNKIKDSLHPVMEHDGEIARLVGRVASLGSTIEEKDRRIRDLKRENLEAQMTESLRSTLSHVPGEAQESFVTLLGESDHYDSIEAFQERLRTVASDFEDTGRYFAVSIDETAVLSQRLAEAHELLEEAAAEIHQLRGFVVERDELIAEARVAINDLNRDVLRAETKLDESIDRAAHLRGQIQTLNESAESTNGEVENQVQELGEALEERDVTIYKYESVMGLANPTETLARLAHARTIVEVDEALDTGKKARRPVTPPTPATSNGGADLVFESEMRDKIFQIMEAKATGIIPEMNMHTEDLIFEGVNTPGGGSAGGGAFTLPGLSPSEMERRVRGDK
jgi:hypothetical protein